MLSAAKQSLLNGRLTPMLGGRRQAAQAPRARIYLDPSGRPETLRRVPPAPHTQFSRNFGHESDTAANKEEQVSDLRR